MRLLLGCLIMLSPTSSRMLPLLHRWYLISTTQILLIHRRTGTDLVSSLLLAFLWRKRASTLRVVCSWTSLGGTESVFLSL